MGLESESRRGYTEPLLQPGPTEPRHSVWPQRASTGAHVQHTTEWLSNTKSQKQVQSHSVLSSSSLMPESAALEGGDQPCSAQAQQALYCGSIHLHWYNLAGAYSEGMLIPEGTVFMEPGCFYGVMDFGLSFLSTSQWARKALEYSSTQVCEAQLAWTQQEKKSPVQEIPAASVSSILMSCTSTPLPKSLQYLCFS